MFENLKIVNANFPWLFGAFAFIFGACVGSFLNVCIYRLPAGRSLIRPGSTCACGTPIPFYLNIPILSWFILRGKAPCCGQNFSFRYPLVESITAFAFLFLWIKFPILQAAVGAIFFSLMLLVAFIDFDTLELPDVLTVGGLVLGLLISAVAPQIHLPLYDDVPFFFNALRGLMMSALGAVVGAGILAILKILAEYFLNREAMGEGDIILLACIGAFCGWQGALFSIFGGSFIGAFALLPLMLFYKIFKPQKEMNAEIPFGPWLAAGALVYFFFFKAQTDFHLSEILGVFFNRQ